MNEKSNMIGDCEDNGVYAQLTDKMVEKERKRKAIAYIDGVLAKGEINNKVNFSDSYGCHNSYGPNGSEHPLSRFAGSERAPMPHISPMPPNDLRFAFSGS